MDSPEVFSTFHVSTTSYLMDSPHREKSERLARRCERSKKQSLPCWRHRGVKLRATYDCIGKRRQHPRASPPPCQTAFPARAEISAEPFEAGCILPFSKIISPVRRRGFPKRPEQRFPHRRASCALAAPRALRKEDAAPPNPSTPPSFVRAR